MNGRRKEGRLTRWEIYRHRQTHSSTIKLITMGLGAADSVSSAGTRNQRYRYIFTCHEQLSTVKGENINNISCLHYPGK
jgi:hypothetical protein